MTYQYVAYRKCFVPPVYSPFSTVSQIPFKLPIPLRSIPEFFPKAFYKIIRRIKSARQRDILDRQLRLDQQQPRMKEPRFNQVPTRGCGKLRLKKPNEIIFIERRTSCYIIDRNRPFIVPVYKSARPFHMCPGIYFLRMI